MTGLLSGKVGVVTGGGRGIGRAIATHMAAEGASVVVMDVNEADAIQSCNEIRSAGGVAESIVCDVTSEDEVVEVFNKIQATHGRIDIACNNAGKTGHDKPIFEFELEHYEDIVRSCMTSTMICMKHEVRAMRDNNGGAIVNISSNAALRGLRNNAPYASAKSGVNTLTRSAASECAKSKIRINAVSPGTIRTPAMDLLYETNPDMAAGLARTSLMGRMGQPTEVADAVIFLLSDKATFITGQVLCVDGGASVR